MTPLAPQLEQQWTQACRSCAAAVIWCTTQSGKSIPVDVGQVYGGNLVLEASDVGIRARYQKPEGNVEAWVAHFATCRFADQHRKGAAEAPTELRLDFGKHKGQQLGAVPSAYLFWLRTKLTEEIERADKQQFRARNEALIGAITATLKAKGKE